MGYLYLFTRLVHMSNRFSKPKHVFYGGRVVGESAMNFLEDIGPEVIHGYEVWRTHFSSRYFVSLACK